MMNGGASSAPPLTAYRSPLTPSPVCPARRVVPFDQLGVVDGLAPLAEGLGLRLLAGGQEPHPLLEGKELLVGAPLVREGLEFLGQLVALELLLELGGGDGLPLLALDLLLHPLEALEGGLVAHPRHRLLDALLRFGAARAGDEDVLLP